MQDRAKTVCADDGESDAQRQPLDAECRTQDTSTKKRKKQYRRGGYRQYQTTDKDYDNAKCDDDMNKGMHCVLSVEKEKDVKGTSSEKVAMCTNVRESESMNSVKPYRVEMSIQGKPIEMEVDTGASRTTISERVYEKHFRLAKLLPAGVMLRSYTGDVVPVLGKLMVNVRYEKQRCKLELLVVKGNCASLLGHDWLSEIRLNWSLMFKVSVNGVNELLKRYDGVFVPDNKGIKGLRAHVKVKPDVQPVFQKPRPVPYALVERVEKELDRLVDSEILYPVEYCEWGTPVVCVQKPNDEIRICGDYKRVNEKIVSDGYKLPNIQDLLAKLTQGKQPRIFTCLDLKGAFNQLKLDEEAATTLVLNTHKGLLATKRLPYGIKVAPAQFQAAMDKILVGIPRVSCYIDDVVIATHDEEEHLEVLEKVLA